MGKDHKEVTRLQELTYELVVGDAMTENVVTVASQATMAEFREIMHTHRVSGTPVVDKGQLVGIVSIEDLIKALADGEINATVGEKMVRLDTYSTSNSNTNDIIFRKSASGSIGTKAETADGEYLGMIKFGGVNSSSDWSENSIIFGAQDGAAGATHVPIEIQIWTGTNAAVRTHRATFHSGGGQTLVFATEDLKFVDAGSAGATEQDWIECTVGGNQGFIRVHAAK